MTGAYYQAESIPFIPFILAVLLAGHGLRKRSLSPSGALAAFIVGFTMMSIPLRLFGITLIVFYLVGSRATKIGKTLKGTLEEGHDEAGYRTAWQVLCNSLTALIAATFWSARFAPKSAHATLFAPLLSQIRPIASEHYNSSSCPLSVSFANGLSRNLIYAVLGHFACCMGDTLASELGILSKNPPRLITTLRTVPPGTNGGISLYGTLCSIIGGALIGTTMAIDLLVENATCRSSSSSAISLIAQLVSWGAFAGGLGSGIDSLLGATIQQTRYSDTSKRIMQDGHASGKKSINGKVVSGLNVLTNNQVNFVSSLLTAVIMASMTS